VFAFFGSAGAMAVDFEGRLVWHRDLGAFNTVWGTAGSPALFEDLVIINADQDGAEAEGPTQSFLIALDKAGGETVWRAERPEQPRSWSTPVVVTLDDGRSHELVLNGGHRVTAYDPRTGNLLWHCAGATQWVTPTVVTGNGLIYAASGPNGPVLAIRPGGRGDVTRSHLAWRAKRGAPYIPSPVFAGGRLYMVNDGGIVTCHDGATGAIVFQGRLPASTFSASLVAAGGNLYITSEQGETYVIAPADKLQIVARNNLGERCLATPALADGQIVLRTEKHLWCLGKR
jgi:outer membrane protein assembly factor BamB